MQWLTFMVSLACVFGLASGAVGLPAQAATPTTTEARYVPGEVVIGWQPGSVESPAIARPGELDEDRESQAWQRAVQTLARRTGLEVLDAHLAHRVARLAAPAGREWAAIAHLRTLPWITYAEPNYIIHVPLPRAQDTAVELSGLTRGSELSSPASVSSKPQGIVVYPNDPFIGDQWNIRRIGAAAAWAVTMGSHSIAVAVIDSGIDRTHPEFAGRLLPGYDYVNSDNDPSDDYGHGTHVAGILAAAANNATGIAGLAPNVKILPLKVLDAGGAGTYANIASAIRRAADSNVQVINLSLGGFYPSSDLQAAVNYAARKALIVAAAGNCAQGGPQCNYQVNPSYYPAAYAGVLAVAACDRYDNWASYSGYKPYIALTAPGGTWSDPIWSTVPGGYDFMYGTSMATPLVSASAALVWTLAPAATYAQVGDILKSTADKVGPYAYTGGRNDYFGSGRLNVAKAVRWAYPPSLTPITETQTLLLGGPVAQQSLRLPLVNPSDQAVWWQATVTQGMGWLNISPISGSTSYSNPNTLVLWAGPTALPVGTYSGVIQVQSIYPQVGGFNIQVRLQIADTVRQVRLPLVSNQALKAIWIDPLAGGQALDLANDSARQLPLPFPVNFYGRTYSAIWVSDNGLAFFGRPDLGATYNRSGCLPSATAPNDAIYVLWQDWNPDLGGQIYAHHPASDRYVLTWHQMRRTAGDSPHSFQLVLLRDGRLLLQYQVVEALVQGTIGIENFDGTVAEQVVCDGVGRPVNSGDALFLWPILPWQ
jgi:thermitase